MTNTSDYCVHASSLWAGMVYPDHEENVLEAWGQGCIELHYAMADIAEIDAEVCNDLFSALGKDFPGVWLYEITEELGRFVRTALTTKGDMPGQAQLRAAHIRLILEFFPQEYQEAVEKYLIDADPWRALP